MMMVMTATVSVAMHPLVFHSCESPAFSLKAALDDYHDWDYHHYIPIIACDWDNHFHFDFYWQGLFWKSWLWSNQGKHCFHVSLGSQTEPNLMYTCTLCICANLFHRSLFWYIAPPLKWNFFLKAYFPGAGRSFVISWYRHLTALVDWLQIVDLFIPFFGRSPLIFERPILYLWSLIFFNDISRSCQNLVNISRYWFLIFPVVLPEKLGSTGGGGVPPHLPPLSYSSIHPYRSVHLLSHCRTNLFPETGSEGRMRFQPFLYKTFPLIVNRFSVNIARIVNAVQCHN